MPAPAAEALPEPKLNELLRQVDWRFLSTHREEPLVADMTNGRHSRAIGLISRGEPAPGGADIAVIGFPTRLALGAARDAVRLGGEIVCLWRVPRLGGGRRAATRLRNAGLDDVRILWPGPLPGRPPQFWLPPDSPEAIRRLLADRPARSPWQRLLRALWRTVASAGLLAPLCAIGRLPTPEPDDRVDEIARVLSGRSAPLLLTGGARSINKVVALPFAEAGGPAAVVKFARVGAADSALDREAAVLRRIEREHSAIEGVPRVLAVGRRSGRRAVAESAIHGRPLIGELSPARLGEIADRLGEWLTGLVGSYEPLPDWRQRLVAGPLAAFERDFGPAVGAETVAAARARLDRLGNLPAACEHRDCSPWNVIVTEAGDLGLLDWESGEPDGLPGMDLVYFLANAAFVLDGALDSGTVRPTYARLLDPRSDCGRVFERSTAAYCARVGVPAAELPRLRLLCWIVHSRSDYRHREMAAAGRPTLDALRSSMFLSLIEEELSREEAP